MNITKKLAIPVIISVIVANVAVIFSIKIKFLEIQNSIYQSEKAILESGYNIKLKSLKELVLVSSLAVAKSAEVINGLINNDRVLTIEGLKSVVSYFQKHTPYEKIKLHVHDKNVHSFVRHWKLNKYGDDLSSFRQTINSVKKLGNPISAIEIGRAGLLLRGISPIIQKNQFIGSAEFILTLDELNSSKASENTKGSNVMFSLIDKQYLEIATSLKNEAVLNSKYVLATKLTNGKDLFTELSGKPLEANGTTKSYYYTTIPIIDFSGNEVGVTILGKSLIAVNQVVSESQSIIENQLYLVAMIFLVLVILLFIILNRVVIWPIKTMSKEIDLSRKNRDLCIRLSHTSNDEIGLISSSYNQLVLLLNMYLGQNHQSIINISEAANLMSEATSATSNGIKNQDIESEEVKANLNIMMNQVQEIADFSQQASNSAQTASSLAQDGKVVSERAIKQITSLVEDITQAMKVVEELKEESQEIESITSVIKTIADQTNLLALNAAIEAARAGESGRGFAVVADEVRNLASKTQDSTTEIDSIIERLKNTIETAVKVMRSSNEQADKSLSDVNDMEQSLESITGSITDITKVNKDIADTTQKQVPLFENLSSNMINSVSQFNMMLNRSLEETSNAAYKMGVSIKGMYSNIEDFKIDENPALLLMAAKSSHFAWKTRIQSYVLGITGIDSSDACSHKDSYFGHWLYSSGEKSFGQCSEFNELVLVHEKVHIELFKLIDSKKRDDKNASESAVLALNLASIKLFQLMDDLGETVGIKKEVKEDKLNESDDNIDLF